MVRVNKHSFCESFVETGDAIDDLYQFAIFIWIEGSEMMDTPSNGIEATLRAAARALGVFNNLLATSCGVSANSGKTRRRPLKERRSQT